MSDNWAVTEYISMRYWFGTWITSETPKWLTVFGILVHYTQ